MNYEAVEAVCQANGEIRERMRMLNARAGRTVIEELDRASLVALILQALGGARSLADIDEAGLEAMLLPAVDEELAARIVEEKPDTIEVLGRPCAVRYPDAGPPWVELTGAFEDNSFLNLPDEGIHLADGSIVEIRLKRERRDALANTNVPALKAEAAAHVNELSWQTWAFKSRKPKPAILLPDPGVEGATIAQVLQVEYGRCCLTGEALVAYGTACAQFEEDPYFTGRWFRLEAEALCVRGAAVEKLNSVKEAAQAQRRAEQARRETEGLLGSLDKLISRLDDRSPGAVSLRKLLAQTRRALPADLNGSTWVADAKALISRADAYLQQASDAVITTFEGYFNRLKGASNADHWVIGLDGALREPDEVKRTREDHAEGNKVWYYIGRREVALSWYGEGSFELAHVPVEGANAAQIQTIGRIETEDLGFGAGFFGLDPELRSHQLAVEQSVAAAVPECPACGQPLGTKGRYWELVGDDGIRHCGKDVVSRFVARGGAGTRSDRGCFGRDANVLRTIATSHGALEMLVYAKHGADNVAFRLSLVPSQTTPERELQSEKVPEQAPEPIAEPPAAESLEEGLGRLLSRFGSSSSLSAVGRVRSSGNE